MVIRRSGRGGNVMKCGDSSDSEEEESHYHMEERKLSAVYQFAQACLYYSYLLLISKELTRKGRGMMNRGFRGVP